MDDLVITTSGRVVCTVIGEGLYDLAYRIADVDRTDMMALLDLCSMNRQTVAVPLAIWGGDVSAMAREVGVETSDIRLWAQQGGMPPAVCAEWLAKVWDRLLWSRLPDATLKFDPERLVQFRKDHRLSQEMLALALDVSRKTVNRWEKRQTVPPREAMIAIDAFVSAVLTDGAVV